MAATDQKRKYIYRIRLRDGQFVQHNEKGEDTTYSKGDVFTCPYPLYKRWPDKYEQVGDFTPLSGGESIKNDPNYDPVLHEDEAYKAAQSGEHSPPTNLPAQALAPPDRSKELMDDAMLEKMTINELKALAEEEEIPISGNSKKEIIDSIKKNRGD